MSESSNAMERSDGIVDAFSRSVARGASDPLVVSPSRCASFADVDATSRAVGDLIAHPGIEPGVLIGLAVPNGPAFLAGFLALRRSGLSVLLLDPLAPSEDRRRTVKAMGGAGMLECLDAWPDSAAAFRLVRTESLIALPGFPGIATVKLTSGSTGRARGVAMRADHLLADEAALSLTMGLRGDDRLLAAIPMSHSYGLVTLALSAIVRGLTLVLPEDSGPLAALDAARKLGASVFPTGPAYLKALLKMSQPPAWPDGIRLIISAGAPLPAATAAEFRRRYGRPVHAFYGSSECGGICFDREGGAAERGTVGTPVEGVRVSIEPMAGVDAGQGLVVVESPAVGATYLPEPDPRLDAGRFETRDLASWRGGELELCGRVDNVINVRGFKVDPAEVESVLTALDGVEEAVVIGVAAADGRDQIVRAVVACPSGSLDYEGIVSWCRLRLADHKVPRSVVIVEAIPRNARGKIDRSGLLALRAAGDAGRTAHG
ncbi:MAG TPA: AMP-binding protein [Thermoanaerobaculia bacterium]|nr:AMP-binding protein [Thermoanaerobaculia bacterium]